MKKFMLLKSKIFSMFLAFFLVSVCFGSSAFGSFFSLEDMTIDFSVINSDFDTYTGVDYFTYEAYLDEGDTFNTVIQQSTGGDGTVDVGDTFIENTYMNLAGVNTGAITLTSGSDTYYVNVLLQNVTGSVTGIGTNATTGEETWDYAFYSGQAVSWVLDTNYDPFDGYSEVLMSGEIVPTSTGTADGFLGLGLSSNWDLTAKITSIAYEGFLLDSGDSDLRSLVSDELLISFTTGDTTIDPDSIVAPVAGNDYEYTFYGLTGDRTELGVVPEPGTLVLMGIGLLCVAGTARRKSKV